MTDLPVNRFKARLGRDTQYGLWLSLMSTASAEIAAGAGFDWVLIDMEHSPNDVCDALAQLRAVESMGSHTHAIVRPPSTDPTAIKRVLDAGALSLLLPYVETEEEATRAVRAARYAPDGFRGVSGMTRATRYGRIDNYIERAAEQIAVIIQIESRKGADNLEAILAVPGIDAVFIGPADLSVDMGAAGDYLRDDVWGEVCRIRQICKLHGMPCGTLMVGEAAQRRAKDLAFDFFGLDIDSRILAQRTDALMAAVTGESQ